MNNIPTRLQQWVTVNTGLSESWSQKSDAVDTHTLKTKQCLKSILLCKVQLFGGTTQTRKILFFLKFNIKHSVLIIRSNQTKVFLTGCVCVWSERTVNLIKEIINVVPQVVVFILVNTTSRLFSACGGRTVCNSTTCSGGWKKLGVLNSLMASSREIHLRLYYVGVAPFLIFPGPLWQ